jgi:hypothetical protein
MLPRYVKIKIYGILILYVVLYGCETWFITSGKIVSTCRLIVLYDRILKRKIGPKTEKVRGSGKKWHGVMLQNPPRGLPPHRGEEV